MRLLVSRFYFLVMAFLLVACSGAAEDEAAPPTATPVEPTPIVASLAATATVSDTATAPAQTSSSKIVYTRIGKNTADLYVMTADRNYQIRLTNGAGVSFEAEWAPNGQLLAYLHYASKTDMTTIQVIAPVADAQPRVLTPKGVKTAQYVSWSADSRYLVYQETPEGTRQQDIYRLDVTSGEIVDLTSDSPSYDSGPAWSPAGNSIAFVSDRDSQTSGVSDIWLMDGDGQNLKNLTSHANAWQNTKPAWSPNGQQLAFYRWTVRPGLEAPGGPAGLWVQNLADGKEQQLVDFTDWLPSDAPVWSPDGQWIAFDYGNQDNTDIGLVSAQGGEPRQISSLPGGEKQIAWAPDAKSFIFTNFVPEGLALYLAQVEGDAPPQKLIEGLDSGFGDWSP